MRTNEGNESEFAAVSEFDVGTDVLFDVLSDSRRRFVIACLREYATPMALGDLADELAIWEYDAEITEIPAAEVTSIYASLYHTHIPKMADAGVVEYSQERDAVTLAASSDELDSLVTLPAVN